jgi:hypothetical protein
VDGAAVSRLQEEREALVIARLRIAQGESEAALRLLEVWRSEAREQERAGSELEIIMLQALAHFAGKRLPQAR